MAYVLIFENKGEVVGVSNPHPHCQIYATNFVFKYIETELDASASATAPRPGRVLFEDVLAAERQDGRRIMSNRAARSPSCRTSRATPTKSMSRRRRAHRDASPTLDRRASAAIWPSSCTTRSMRFDNLWRMPFPYVMALHQAPADGTTARGFHFHIEFHPPLRRPNLLKYLAGPEIGGGNFLSDTSPEEKAAELRRRGRRRTTKPQAEASA